MTAFIASGYTEINSDFIQRGTKSEWGMFPRLTKTLV